MIVYIFNRKELMDHVVHILNGDSLNEQFPREIRGERIVLRECLVDGDVSGSSLDELYETRSAFISEAYGEYLRDDYYVKSVSQFEKIQSIPEGSEINLWFEDDLFCQVNFWFAAYLISNSLNTPRTYLVRPQTHTRYGFAGLKQSELVRRYHEKTPISNLADISQLWSYYQTNQTQELVKAAKELEADYPFIYNAVQAHVDRLPVDGQPGKPVNSLKEIMDELESDAFGPVFNEFCRREPIYGYGDLQVKRLYDEIKRDR